MANWTFRFRCVLQIVAFYLQLHFDSFIHSLRLFVCWFLRVQNNIVHRYSRISREFIGNVMLLSTEQLYTHDCIVCDTHCGFLMCMNGPAVSERVVASISIHRRQHFAIKSIRIAPNLIQMTKERKLKTKEYRTIHSCTTRKHIFTQIVCVVWVQIYARRMPS